jgi:hypothetical protein
LATSLWKGKIMIARAPQSVSHNLILSAKLGLVSVPTPDVDGPAHAASAEAEPGFDRDDARELLHGLGRDLGMTSLVVKEDVFPEAEGSEESRSAFPDEAVRKTLEGLDVVWMQDGEVVAGFVLEASAGPWEGIRRLADLLALHPKLKASLYAVSMPSLKAGLLAEIHRPVYRLLKKPLPETVRLLDWPRLQSEVTQLGERVRYLKPEFLAGISDVSELPAAI